ncbi:MAG: hypothetical protein IKQ97_04670 [Eubacterium sp.]|nr:hypothetical protein [Eubacterium sp.]
MSDINETIARIHERAGEMKKNQIRRRLQIESIVTGALGVCLIAMLVIVGTGSGGLLTDVGTAAEYAGASMLNANVGGYIITGVVAFLFGAALAILIRTYHEKKRHEQKGQIL